jgi:hypothetical protein
MKLLSFLGGTSNCSLFASINFDALQRNDEFKTQFMFLVYRELQVLAEVQGGQDLVQTDQGGELEIQGYS